MTPAAPQTHTVGSKVWARDDDREDIWQRGEVLKADGGALVVRTEKGAEVSAGADDFPLQNLDAQGVEVNLHQCLRRAQIATATFYWELA